MIDFFGNLARGDHDTMLKFVHGPAKCAPRRPGAPAAARGVRGPRAAAARATPRPPTHCVARVNAEWRGRPATCEPTARARLTAGLVIRGRASRTQMATAEDHEDQVSVWSEIAVSLDVGDDSDDDNKARTNSTPGAPACLGSYRPQVTPGTAHGEAGLDGLAHCIALELWLGCEDAALRPLSELQALGIGAVVNCTSEGDGGAPCLHAAEGIEYWRVAVHDTGSADILSHLSRTADWITARRERGTAVLVHSQEGVSRSATVIIAALMHAEGLGRDAAYLRTKEARRVAEPNHGFWVQLAQFEANQQHEREEGRRKLAHFWATAPIVDAIRAEVRESHSRAFDFKKGASEVVEGFLYLGGKQEAADGEWHRRIGITHVLNCADSSARGAPSMDEHLHYCQLDAADDHEFQILSTSLSPALDFIRHAAAVGGRVLVHCHAGVNRSAAIVVGYLATDNDMGVVAAVRKVWAARPIVLVNQDFIRQLAGLELKLSGAAEATAGGLFHHAAATGESQSS